MNDELNRLQEERANVEKDTQARNNLTWLESIFSPIPRHTENDKYFLDSEINWYARRLASYKKECAEAKSLLRHEIAHSINEDLKGRVCALFAVPVAVQAVCSGATYNFNKLCGIKAPTTPLRTAFRSSLAVGNIPFKIVLGYLGQVFYWRYQEKRADVYSCENAMDRLELEEYRDFFQEAHARNKSILLSSPEKILKDNAQGIFKDDEIVAKMLAKKLNESTEIDDSLWIKLAYLTFDPKHPYPGDRADMVQEYIKKWDEDHKEVIS
jgi:Zn-dependent protease with chaperone function